MWGVAENLWSSDPDLANRCVNALSMEATLIQGQLERDEDKSSDQRRDMDEIMAESAMVVRNAFFKDNALNND